MSSISKNMLSICIPVFNYPIENLVNTLHNQCRLLNIQYEIICIDDASDLSFRKLNSEICNQVGRYIQLEQNIGRAKIRNLFAINALYDNLLFLDCDLLIHQHDFVKKYMEAMDSSSRVICGGLEYSTEKPGRDKQLRWKYGNKKESISLVARAKYPYKSFMSSNFMITREIFKSVMFDERLSKYGHEDTLFGYHLQKEDIPVYHIDNTVLHNHMEINSMFILKTEQSLLNLIQILEYVDYHPTFISNIKILSFYKSCLNKHLSFFIIVLFHISKPVLRLTLTSPFTSLKSFDIYKLGFLASKTNATIRKSIKSNGKIIL